MTSTAAAKCRERVEAGVIALDDFQHKLTSGKATREDMRNALADLEQMAGRIRSLLGAIDQDFDRLMGF